MNALLQKGIVLEAKGIFYFLIHDFKFKNLYHEGKKYTNKLIISYYLPWTYGSIGLRTMAKE